MPTEADRALAAPALAATLPQCPLLVRLRLVRHRSWFRSRVVLSPGSSASVSARTTATRLAPAVRTAAMLLRGDPADGEERHLRPGGRVADELEPDGRAPGLGRGGVDGADADVVDRECGSGVDLGRTVRGESDEAILADQRARPRHRNVVLPHVNAVGSGRRHEIRDGR